MEPTSPSEGELVARDFLLYTVFGVVAFCSAVILYVLS